MPCRTPPLQDPLSRRRPRQRGDRRGPPGLRLPLCVGHRKGRPGGPVCGAAGRRVHPVQRQERQQRRQHGVGERTMQRKDRPAPRSFLPFRPSTSTPDSPPASFRARSGHERGAAQRPPHPRYPGHPPAGRRPRVLRIRQGAPLQCFVHLGCGKAALQQQPVFSGSGKVRVLPPRLLLPLPVPCTALQQHMCVGRRMPTPFGCFADAVVWGTSC